MGQDKRLTGQLSLSFGIILLMLITLSQGAYADVGTHSTHRGAPVRMDLIDYDYVISNIGDYPDYEFIVLKGTEYNRVERLLPSISSAEIIDRINGTIHIPPGAPYFWSSICAIKTIDFDKKSFGSNPNKYLGNNPNIIYSNVSLKNGYNKRKKVYDQVDHVTFYLRVDSITDNFLHISGIKIINHYIGGHVHYSVEHNHYSNGHTSEVVSTAKNDYFTSEFEIPDIRIKSNQNNSTQNTYSDKPSNPNATKNYSSENVQSELTLNLSSNNIYRTWFFIMPLTALLVISFIVLRKYSIRRKQR